MSSLGNMRRRLWPACTVMLLCAALSFPTWGAGVYKWVDEQGNVHYGDRPQTPDAQSLQLRSGPAADPGLEQRQERRERLLDVFEEERREKKEQEAQIAQDKAERQQRCAQARAELEAYDTAGYLYQLDEQGERVILNDEQHAQALAQSRQAVEHWCRQGRP